MKAVCYKSKLLKISSVLATEEQKSLLSGAEKRSSGLQPSACGMKWWYECFISAVIDHLLCLVTVAPVPFRHLRLQELYTRDSSSWMTSDLLRHGVEYQRYGNALMERCHWPHCGKCRRIFYSFKDKSLFVVHSSRGLNVIKRKIKELCFVLVLIRHPCSLTSRTLPKTRRTESKSSICIWCWTNPSLSYWRGPSLLGLTSMAGFKSNPHREVWLLKGMQWF